MIKLLDNTKQPLHLLTQVKEFYIESELEKAEKIIHFIVARNSAFVADIKQENYLQIKDARFIIKEINYSQPDYIEVFGKLDVEELRAKKVREYESVGREIGQVLDDLLVGTGWTYSLVDIPVKRRTMREENQSVYSIIVKAMNLYGFEVEFDTINRVVIVKQLLGTDKGAYVYTNLNMKRLEYQSDTYELRTRLYAYGKDGLTFASINGGKEYVDNFTFSNRIIEEVWIDERYTDAASLLADATARLAVLAAPRVSYRVELMELSKVRPEYTILSYGLGDRLRIIDKQNKINETHRIVKTLIYPLQPERNSAELANTRIIFQDNTEQVREIVTGEIIRTRTELMEEIERATDLITGANGGFVILRYNVNGQPYEQLIMDTDNILTAQKVWRWNVEGLGYSSTGYNGPYELAITADGRINANFITTGFLSANRIKAGILTSTNGNSYIDLDTGYFKFGNFMKLDATGFELKLSSGKTVETAIGDAKTEAKGYTDTKTTEAKDYADSAAANAQSAAEAYALAQAALAEAEAQAYADGIVSDEEAARIADATAKLNEAKTYAETKANEAKTAAQAYADTQLGTFATTVNGTLDELQNQIDGSITTWFYNVPPTTSNVPASSWTTTELKNIHLGDLYYDTFTGYAYRWQVVGGVYSWQRITDSDVTKALQDAAKAQDTADSKRRVFTATPTTPYEIGDLWAQGTTGELMRCRTTALTGAYVASHWEKASKYTDDTTANANLITAKTYAETKASEAQAAAEALAIAKANLAETQAKAYADGVVDAEEQARITEAEANLEAAQGYADARAVDEAQAAKEYADALKQELAETLNEEVDKLQIAWVYDIIPPIAPFDNMVWVDISKVPNVPKRYVASNDTWVSLTAANAEELGAYSKVEGEALASNLATLQQTFNDGSFVSTVVDSEAFQSVLSGKLDKGSFASAFEQNAESIVASVATVKNTADGAAANFQTVRNYMDFSPSGLLIGQSDSALKVNITNEELQFLNGINKVAYMSGLNMFITNANITNKIKIGVHELEKHDSNITILRWVGE